MARGLYGCKQRELKRIRNLMYNLQFTINNVQLAMMGLYAEVCKLFIIH